MLKFVGTYFIWVVTIFSENWGQKKVSKSITGYFMKLLIILNIKSTFKQKYERSYHVVHLIL